MWHWHAYNYGFRCVYFGKTDATYPGDPQGEWFDRGLAVQAGQMWLGKMKTKRSERISPADQAEARGDHAKAELFRRQDRERLAAAHLSDHEYVELCMRQVRANLKTFLDRNQAAQEDPIARIHRELGVSARESQRS